MSGKPHESTFQCFLQIAIPSSLEEVMAIFVTVREADRKSEPKASSARSPRARFALGLRCYFLLGEPRAISPRSPQDRPLFRIWGFIRILLLCPWPILLPYIYSYVFFSDYYHAIDQELWHRHFPYHPRKSYTLHLITNHPLMIFTCSWEIEDWRSNQEEKCYQKGDLL